MARTMFRDVGGGRRRGNARFIAAAWCVLLMVAVLPGCDLTTPSSPNDPGNLTGQTTNQTFVFTGTLGVSSSASTLVADDTSTVLLIVEVKDSSGNPIQNLTTVGFSTDLGAFNVGGALFTVAQATTFNGSAEILLQSANRQAGTATVTATLGTVSSSSSVKLTVAPVEGTIALAFGTTGDSSVVVLSGVASSATPLDSNIGVTALDLEGTPIVGANVSFRITQDTTADTTSNPNAEFVATRHTTTGPDGTTVNVLRVFGPGVVVVEAELFDPNTGNLVARSNRIILTTTQAVSAAFATLAFADGSTSFAAVAPYSNLLTVTVTDGTGAPQAGRTVRLSITADTTDTGAGLSTTLAITDAFGRVTSTLTVPDNAPSGGAGSTSVVSITAEVLDSLTGAVVSTSNVIVATGT